MTTPPDSRAIAFDAHGAPDYAELSALGLQPDDVLDFSVNSNPFGPSPAVLAALASVPLDRYPDRECLALRAALAERHTRDPDCIVCGNGVADLLWLLAAALLRPGDDVLVLGPTFGEYARSARLFGAAVHEHRAAEAAQFVHDLAAIGGTLAARQWRLVYLCNPNNPTGTIIPLATIATWAAAHPECIFVIDEAYQPFVSGMLSAISLKPANLLVLRSMTKDYALAGLRLGYAVAAPAIIDRLAHMRPPWQVNALAQAAGLAALADAEWYAARLAELRASAADLRAGLAGAGYPMLPAHTHYGLVRVGDAAAFRRRLLQQHAIQVRDCTSFGLPAWVRIASRTPADNAHLLAALDTEAAHDG